MNPDPCPLWAQELTPNWLSAYKGLTGLPKEISRHFPSVNAPMTSGIDRYQANHFIAFRSETAAFLLHDYTPLEVHVPVGLFPELEEASKNVKGNSITERVEAILELLRDRLRHPYIPPVGAEIPTDRNLDEEALLRSGSAWCNEQVRVFIRLCQIQGISARMIHLFHSVPPSGHTIAEFHDGHHWCLTDVSYFIIYRRENGMPLSAAECHDLGAGQARYGKLLHQHVQRLLHTQPRRGSLAECGRHDQWLTNHGSYNPEDYAGHLHSFGVMNYPLPPRMQDPLGESF